MSPLFVHPVDGDEPTEDIEIPAALRDRAHWRAQWDKAHGTQEIEPMQVVAEHESTTERELEALPPAPPEPELAGDLAYFDVVDVVQTLEMTKATGVLEVRSPPLAGRARIYWDNGEIIHLRHPCLKGTHGVTRVLRYATSGRFSFYAGPSDQVPSFRTQATALLLEAVRQRDEGE